MKIELTIFLKFIDHMNNFIYLIFD